jgi:septal ring factor EnvC (AmiA/AmiB activator)
MRNLAQSTGTAHRPTREERKSKEYQELRRENQHLSREVARLRKHLGKAQATKGAFESPEEQRPERESEPRGVGCPKCSTEGSPPMTEIPIPIGTLLVCGFCQHRFVQRAA